MTIAGKIRRWAPRALAALFFLFTFALVGVYWFLEHDPYDLADKFLSDLSKRTGLKFEFNSVEVTLLPFPAIGVSDIKISGPDLEFTMPWLAVRPDFIRILRGDFTPASVTLLRPKFYASGDFDFSDPQKLKERFSSLLNSQTKSGVGDLLSGCTLIILRGFAEITGAEGQILRLNGLRADVKIGAGWSADGDLEFSGLRLIKGNRHVFTLATFSLAGAFSPENFFKGSNNLRVSGVFRLDNLFQPTEFSLAYESSGKLWNCRAAVDGRLELENYAAPFSLNGLVTSLADSTKINARGIAWKLDADSGRLDLSVRPPKEEDPLEIDGSFIANRLSLVQWLGFASRLPPGLRLALDNLENVKIDFKCTPKSVTAKSIEASCLGSRFTGSGGVANFAKPEVVLNLKAPRINLAAFLPESIGASPDAPVFPHPPLTPVPGKPLEPGATGVDYDLRFAVETAAYGPLTLKNLALRINQGKMDKTRVEDTLLDGRADCLGGRVTGNCILSGLPGTPINIVTNVTNISAAKLAAAYPKAPVRKGVLGGRANVMSKGTDLKTFLANLNGSLSLTASSLKFSGFAEDLTTAETRVTLRSAKPETDRIAATARWRGSVATATWKAEGDLNGKISFSTKDATLKNLPLNFQFKTLKKMEALPAGFGCSGNGSASFEGGKFTLNKFSAETAATKLTGSLNFDSAKTAYKGSVNAQIPNVADTLKKIGLNAPRVPEPLKSLRLNANFSGDKNSLSLTAIKADFPEFPVSGKFSWQSRDKKPWFEFDLSAGAINLASFAGAKSSGGDWNYAFMREFGAKGDLKIAAVDVFGLKLTNVSLPIRLDNGRALFGPNGGQFYGAQIQSTGMINFNNGFSFNSVTGVRGFDLNAVARDRKLGGVMTGKASVDARIEASVRGSQKLIDALTGVWKLNASEGSWQSLKNGKPDGKPIKFNEISANGSIEKGVVKSDDCHLKGPELELKGGGWINLTNDKLDCNFNVNMKGVPDFPLRLYGRFDKPETSVGVGRMALNAIGGLASGFVNIIGGIFEGAWKIFR